MDTVEHVSVVDHIRKRLGMYWLTREGIPDKSVRRSGAGRFLMWIFACLTLMPAVTLDAG